MEVLQAEAVQPQQPAIGLQEQQQPQPQQQQQPQPRQQQQAADQPEVVAPEGKEEDDPKLSKVVEDETEEQILFSCNICYDVRRCPC